MTIKAHWLAGAALLLALSLNHQPLPAQPGAMHASHTTPAAQEATPGTVLMQMMDRMMTQMHDVKLTGPVEADFIVQMIPHHRGAVEMAEYEIAHGRNPQMIALAKKIVAEQEQEIARMQVMLKGYAGKTATPPAGYEAGMDRVMQRMMQEMPQDPAAYTDPDCAFARIMWPHHQGAVGMAEVILKYNPDKQIAGLAEAIIGSQEAQIEQMKDFLDTSCGK